MEPVKLCPVAWNETGLADNPDFRTENVAMMRWIRCSALLMTVLVAACGGKGSPADPPTDLAVQSNGDTQVTLNWTAQPGLQYWVLCAPGNTVTSTSWANTAGGNAYSSARDGAGIYNGDTALAGQVVTPPFNVTGLRNDVTYSFTVNARTNGGSGGAGATAVTVAPHLAGRTWSSPQPPMTSVPNTVHVRSMTYGALPSPVNTAYAAFRFVAVGSEGNAGAVYASADNQRSWVSMSANLPSAAAGQQLNDVTFAFGRFVAVGNAGTIVYSANGVNWATASVGSANLSNINLTALAFSGSTLMAVGQGGTVLTSSDGVTWVAQTANIAQDLHAVAFSPAVTTTLPSAVTSAAFWVAVGAAGAVYTSPDGLAWTRSSTGQISSASGAWRGVAVLVNTTSTLDCGLVSPAVTSVSVSYSIALVGDGGQVATAGPDLVWNLSTQGSSTLNRVISPAGQFVAVGNAGAVYTGELSVNTTGVTWTPRTSGTSSDLHGLIRYGKDAGLSYSNSYIAYGQGGVTLFSRN